MMPQPDGASGLLWRGHGPSLAHCGDRMETLLELLSRIERLGSKEAFQFSNGYRTWRWTYRDLNAGIRKFSSYLHRHDVRSGDRLVLWAENRPEWVAVFWACLARGVHVVPLDRQSSEGLVNRIVAEAGAKIVAHSGPPPGPPGRIETFAIEALRHLPDGRHLSPAFVSGDDIAEIVYTSGTTAEPKGVIHLHRNICSNLDPIRQEIERYRTLATPFQPIRMLCLLPLSHMFGQSMGVFIPPVLGGSASFMTGLHPTAVRETIREQRISILVCVPRMLESLRGDIERHFPSSATRLQGSGGPLARWWRHRDIHRALGLKFWAFVVGGAKLDRGTEAFWSKVGLLVIQGYGLTETSPVVAVNHPFRARRGTLGEVIGSQEVRIADDGEILVKGNSVVRDYLKRGRTVRAVDDEGWFHTGDIGAMDEEDRLVYLGRKKDVIITSDGLNVHPVDVERHLVRQDGVKDAVVVGVGPTASPRVHAALIFDSPGQDPMAVVERVNPRLEPHQRIQSATEWPDDVFPRTHGTLKTQRNKVAERLASVEAIEPAPAGSAVDGMLLAAVGRGLEDLPDERRLEEDLGMSSLERVDLLASLEDRHGVRLSDEAFATLSTVGQVRAWAEAQASVRRRDEKSAAQRQSGTDSSAPANRFRPPRWARGRLLRAVRIPVRSGLVLPLFRQYIELTVVGRENLDLVSPPTLFAANHASHLDTVAVLASLPHEWRPRLAPAASQQHFFPTGDPQGLGRRIGMRAQYWLACGLFNAYPLSQDPGHVRDTLRYTGELVAAGFCPLVYPEGEMTADGSMQPFRRGIAAMSQRLEIPVVPVRLDGLFRIMSRHDSWPRSGPVRVAFGPPISPRASEGYAQLAARIEESVRDLVPSGGTGDSSGIRRRE